MSNQRQQVRTPMKCRIKISHPSFGELLAQTRDLSDSGVYVKHPDMAGLACKRARSQVGNGPGMGPSESGPHGFPGGSPHSAEDGVCAASCFRGLQECAQVLSRGVLQAV